jgi:ABC-type phosphate/phosphonate transport system substrate-binding protein
VTVEFARESFAQKMGVPLKVVGKTVGVPRAPMVAHRRVPLQEREAIQKLLMSWGDDPRNRLPVPGAQVPSLVPVDSAEYDGVLQIWRSLAER